MKYSLFQELLPFPLKKLNKNLVSNRFNQVKPNLDFMKKPAFYSLLFIVAMAFFTSCGKDSDSNPDGPTVTTDTKAPTVVSSTPVDDATNVSLTTGISITYSEEITLADNYQITVNGVSTTCSVVSKKLYITATLDNSINYEIIIPANTVKDAAGNFAAALTLNFRTVAKPVVPFDGVGTYEAEKAYFSTNLGVLTALTGFSGTGYIGNFTNTNDTVKFDIENLEKKYYDVYIKYNTADFEGKYCNVNINGSITKIELPDTHGAFVEIKFGKVKLLAGDNTIIVTPNWTWFILDYVRVAENTDPVVPIDASLVTPNPSSQAVNVYNFLKENYGTKIISATMSNVAWNINEAEWVKQHTGKYPAMTTVDYIQLPYSPANWIDYSDISFVQNWWNNNGLFAAGWHWIVPKSEGSTEYTYKPEETTFSAANATVEGTWENDIVKADLAKMAGYLKLLKDQNIPVIWRPLHEASGNFNTGGTAWFWWGYSGAESYKKLWIYMFDYFQTQGLNNLIWVWTTQTNDNAYYPGDAYVDIIGRDIYTDPSGASIASQFNTIQGVYPNKLVTLSECGGVANISAQWDAGSGWSYFMPWYDYDRTNDMNSSAFKETSHQYANADWWKDAMSKSYVIKRDDMPSLK